MEDGGAAFTAVLREAAAGGGFRGVVHTWSVAAAEAAALTVAGLAAAQRLGVGSVRWVLQGVVASGVGGRVWVVTREAVEAGGCGVRGLAQAPVWGLGKVCGLEHPGEWGGLIDVAWGDEAAGVAAVVERRWRATDGGKRSRCGTARGMWRGSYETVCGTVCGT